MAANNQNPNWVSALEYKKEEEACIDFSDRVTFSAAYFNH